MKRILLYLKPFRLRMLVGFIIKVTGTMAELVLPYILTYILENVITELNIGKVIAYGGMMFFAVVACLGNITANRMAARVTTNFSKAMRKELFEKTLYLSSADTDAFTIPSIESRITTDTYNVHNFIGMMQRMGVRAPILLLGGISFTLIMDKALSLVMIATLPIIFVTVYGISRKGVPLYTRVQKAVDDMIRVVREDSRGIRVIKALSRVPKERERYDEVNKRLVQAEKKASLTMGAVNPIMALLMNLGITFVVLLGAYRVMGGETEAGKIVAFTQYFTMISNATLSVTRIFMMYTKSSASAERIRQVIDAPMEPIPHDETAFPPICEEEHISFRDVSFAYNEGKPVLHDLSFSLPKGGTLGIIGATGSGKTTLVNLLMRMYDVTEGTIRIHGRDVRTIPTEELRRKFGVAMQNDFLYADTVYENIRFGRDLTEEQIRMAAELACAHEFITAMPDGYQSMLASKGANLSGGQKQRLLIARALAARPEILILDDSFSALDYRTDARLRSNLKDSGMNCTAFLVAQRVSSVMHADLILVLEEGVVIGRGTHDQLLDSCPIYREIYDTQMGGSILD